MREHTGENLAQSMCLVRLAQTVVSGTSSSPLLLLVTEMDYDWTSENWAGGPKKVLCRVQAGPGGMAKIVGAVGQARETGFRPPCGQ